MGERLNIEIHNKGKVLANCYYHWSGYSNSAAQLAQEIIHNIGKIENTGSDLLYAVKLLESTGGGLTEREIEHAKTLDDFNDYKFAECEGRNNGLIAISKDEIQNTRSWQEHALYIYLDENRMSFKVFWSKDKWDWEKERKEDFDEEVKAKDLEKVDINFDDIKFSDIDSFVEFVDSHKEEPFTTVLDSGLVYDMIY
jgi:hypothetical protein